MTRRDMAAGMHYAPLWLGRKIPPNFGRKIPAPQIAQPWLKEEYDAVSPPVLTWVTPVRASGQKKGFARLFGFSEQLSRLNCGGEVRSFELRGED